MVRLGSKERIWNTLEKGFLSGIFVKTAVGAELIPFITIREKSSKKVIIEGEVHTVGRFLSKGAEWYTDGQKELGTNIHIYSIIFEEAIFVDSNQYEYLVVTPEFTTGYAWLDLQYSNKGKYAKLPMMVVDRHRFNEQPEKYNVKNLEGLRFCTSLSFKEVIIRANGGVFTYSREAIQAITGGVTTTFAGLKFQADYAEVEIVGLESGLFYTIGILGEYEIETSNVVRPFNRRSR